MITKTLKLRIKDMNDITIKDYIRLNEVMKIENDLERTIELVSILTFLKKENVKKFEINSLLDIVEKANTILSKEPNLDDLIEFKLDGVKYKFDFDLDKMSVGQFVDLHNFTKENILDNLHVISAILFRPSKNFKYNSEDIMKRSELFKEKLTISKAYSASFFFLNLKKIYLKNTKEFLEHQ